MLCRPRQHTSPACSWVCQLHQQTPSTVAKTWVSWSATSYCPVYITQKNCKKTLASSHRRVHAHGCRRRFLRLGLVAHGGVHGHTGESHEGGGHALQAQRAEQLVHRGVDAHLLARAHHHQRIRRLARLLQPQPPAGGVPRDRTRGGRPLGKKLGPFATWRNVHC